MKNGVDVRRKIGDGLADIVLDKSKVRIGLEMGKVVAGAGKEVVDADDFVAVRDEAVTKMRTYESSASGN